MTISVAHLVNFVRERLSNNFKVVFYNALNMKSLLTTTNHEVKSCVTMHLTLGTQKINTEGIACSEVLFLYINQNVNHAAKTTFNIKRPLCNLKTEINANKLNAMQYSLLYLSVWADQRVPLGDKENITG